MHLMSSYVSQDFLQPGFERHIRGRSGRPAEPGVEHLPGQPVLGTRLAGFHGEFVQPLRFVFEQDARRMRRQGLRTPIKTLD